MRRDGFRARISGFATAQGGNVAIIFALCSIPLIGSVGAAIDYTRASYVKTSMQEVADATALMLARTAGTQTSNQMQRLGSKYFNAQLKVKEANNIQVDISYTQGDSTVEVTGTANVKTTFMNLIGMRRIKVGVSSTATWGAKSRLRVALVLDNTGSMADAGKMKALQTAAKDLLASLSSAAEANGDVYVSIIPFSKDVNVGTGNSGASWLGWKYWDDTYGSCSSRSYGDQSSCTSHRATWSVTSHSRWNGCITDRDQNYDTTNTPPSLPETSPSTLYPADQDGTCPVQMIGMTNNWSSLNSVVSSMSPNGTTNQSIGLEWGWLSLTPDSILNPPELSPGYTYTKHIVLLTDGLNTQDRYYTDQASIDAREKIVCDNIKADGITLWTIQVNTDGDPTSELLRECASDPSKFFTVNNADGIISTFENIKFQITQLHISK